MTIRRHTLVMILIRALLGIVLLLIVAAVCWPDSEVRRVLLAVVLFAAVGLLLLWIAIEAAELDQLRRQCQVDRKAHLVLSRRFAAHAARYAAHREADRLDSQIRAMDDSTRRSA